MTDDPWAAHVTSFDIMDAQLAGVETDEQISEWLVHHHSRAGISGL